MTVETSYKYQVFRETFNKHETVNTLKEEGLPVVKSILVENSKVATDEFLDRLGSRVGYPCVVKPNKGTASAGEARSLLSSVT